MIYHVDDTMEKSILEELSLKKIKVDKKETFIYNGFKINLIDRTIECLNPIKSIYVKYNRGGI